MVAIRDSKKNVAGVKAWREKYPDKYAKQIQDQITRKRLARQKLKAETGLEMSSSEHHKKYMREWHAANKDKVAKYLVKKRPQARKHTLKLNYGLTLEQYDAIKKKQKGVCAICQQAPAEEKSGKRKSRDPERLLCVDHNHRTGEIRGLLCNTCNRCIGLLKDDPTVMKRFSRYLLKHGTGKFIPNPDRLKKRVGRPGKR